MLNIFILNDYPLQGQLFFQDPGSTNLIGMIDLHDRIMFPLITIIGLVFWIIFSILSSKNSLGFTVYHGNTIELIWTIIPAIVLWTIGIPSLKLLYLLDQESSESLHIKVIGNQWYWTYEINDVSYDSYIVQDDDLNIGEFHNLMVDNPLFLPIFTPLKFIVTSNDVIHSFAVPSLGIKMDAIPGRLNATNCIITRPSIYHGQCSELCGVLHGFMPITIIATDIPSFLSNIAALD